MFYHMNTLIHIFLAFQSTRLKFNNFHLALISVSLSYGHLGLAIWLQRQGRFFLNLFYHFSHVSKCYYLIIFVSVMLYL